MLFALMIGVGTAGSVKVGFFDPYPVAYTAAGCIGLAGYIFCIGLIQMTIEERESSRYSGWGLKGFGIAIALLIYLIAPYIDAIVANLLFMIALGSQIFVPIARLARDLD